jgi:HSP20 family protein
MAQTQTETRSNMPARMSRGRGGQLMSRDAAAWAASPFGLMRRLSDDMDQLFGQLVGGLAGAGPVTSGQQLDWVPAIEMEQRDNQIVVRADLPGMNVDDVTVEVDEGVLTIAGERRDEREVEGNGGRRRTEVRYGRFARSIVLPENAHADEIEAVIRQGVLEIKIPMEAQGRAQRRKIDVQGSSASDGQRQSSATSASASSKSSGQQSASSSAQQNPSSSSAQQNSSSGSSQQNPSSREQK